MQSNSHTFELAYLDEPTNHLDELSKDELKNALKNFKGTLLLVCHDPDFYKDIVTNVWNMEGFINYKI